MQTQTESREVTPGVVLNHVFRSAPKANEIFDTESTNSHHSVDTNLLRTDAISDPYDNLKKNFPWSLLTQTLYFDIYRYGPMFVKIGSASTKPGSLTPVLGDTASKNTRDSPLNFASMYDPGLETRLKRIEDRIKKIDSVIEFGEFRREVHDTLLPHFPAFVRPWNSPTLQQQKKLYYFDPQFGSNPMNPPHSGKGSEPMNLLNLTCIPSHIVSKIQIGLQTLIDQLLAHKLFAYVLNESCLLINSVGDIRFWAIEHLYELSGSNTETMARQHMQKQVDALLQSLPKQTTSTKMSERDWDMAKCILSPLICAVKENLYEHETWKTRTNKHPVLDSMRFVGMEDKSEWFVSAVDPTCMVKVCPIETSKKSSFSRFKWPTFTDIGQTEVSFSQQVANIQKINQSDIYPENIPKCLAYFVGEHTNHASLYIHDSPNVEWRRHWKQDRVDNTCSGYIVLENLIHYEPVLHYLDKCVTELRVDAFQQCIRDILYMAYHLIEQMNPTQSSPILYLNNVPLDHIVLDTKERSQIANHTQSITLDSVTKYTLRVSSNKLRITDPFTRLAEAKDKTIALNQMCLSVREYYNEKMNTKYTSTKELLQALSSA